jgi:hypothetical protein
VYNLKLNEFMWLNVGTTEVMRVPGGWIYKVYDEATQRNCLSMCFVPFNNEFMETSDTAELAATDSQQLKAEIATLATELQDFNDRRVSAYGRVTEIVAKMRQLSAV